MKASGPAGSILRAAAAGLLWLLAGCADDRVAGGGTETGNADVVSGRVAHSDGSGVSGLDVFLHEPRTRSDGGDSGAVFQGKTDGQGKYAFKKVPKGRYALYAAYPFNSPDVTSAILTRLEKGDSTLVLKDAIARRQAQLRGRVLPPAGVAVRDVRVCVPGVQACVHPGADSVYLLPNVPRGGYELLFLTASTATYLELFVRAETEVVVDLRDVGLADSADDTHVPYRFYALPQARSFATVPVAYPKGLEPAWYADKDFSGASYSLLSETGPSTAWNGDYLARWKYSKTLDANALFTGPGLAQGLPGFPLPVRLTAAEIDFTQAAPDGSDLAVSDTTGRILPYEIERWDAAAGRAEIWVRLDSLAASPSGRKLRLHWGNPASPFRSEPARVFPAADGLIGAWHFHRAPLSAAVGPADALGAFPGSMIGPAPAAGYPSLTTQDGAFGPSLRLGRTGDHVRVPHQAALDVTQAFTVCVWARLDLPDNGVKQVLAAKWLPGRREWHLDIQPNRTFEMEFGGADGAILGEWRSLAPVANPGAWHHYAAVFDRGTVRLYLDGAETPGAAVAGGAPASIGRFTADMAFGSNSIDTTLNLRGDLDEFRYYSTAKSAEWIGMSYRTEKPRP